MIPHALEELVLCQKAFSKTISLGRSGQLVIPVTDEATIVIWHFDYFNFVDATIIDSITQAQNRSVHQVIFRTPKSLNNFVIKDDLTITRVAPPAPDVTPINVANVVGHYSKDCYLIHDDDIVVTISVAPEVGGTVSTPGFGNPGIKPEEPPLGYGTAPATAIAQTVNEVLGAATGEIIAQGAKFGAPVLPPPNPYVVGTLRYPINAGTLLNPTFSATPEGQRSYPILNIDYVEINRNVAQQLFSSS